LFAPGYDADDYHEENIDMALVNEAVQVAQQASVVLLFIGLPEIVESEGFDRDHLDVPAQHVALVEKVCQVNPNTVVILSNGGALEIPWHSYPKAILEGYLLGEAGGGAVVDLIFGVQSPCGKLAETVAERMEDILANKYFPGSWDRVEHREGLLVGYRYFDTCQKRVLYPFGHGLSYATFSYDSLRVETIQDDIHEKLVEVSFTIQNTGQMAGKEVIQCYVHDIECSVFRPEQELKDFKKVHLEPGEIQQVQFILVTEAFSFYDIGIGGWIVERGDFEIRIGSSSRDIRLSGTTSFLQGPETASPLACASYPPVESFEVEAIDDTAFATRFGKDNVSVYSYITNREFPDVHKFHRNSLIKDVAKSRWIGKLLLWIVYRAASKEVKKGPTENRQKRLILETVENLPLRTLVLFSRGGMSFDTLDACIELMNCHVWGALRGFFISFYHFIRPKR
jgi:beta-glucosidase